MFSIKSLILLTALAAILVLLTAITVSATVYSPWTREAVDTTSTTDIQCAKVGDADNDGLVEIAIGVDGTGDDIYMYESPSPDSTRRFIDPTPANYTQELDFTWGVLAINTHKSIYLPNETAFISIAVLDNDGHMVCDADVTLTITDPSNNETVLSTSNGLIKVSPQCTVYGVTNLPDFYTNYEVGGVGTYVMNLTAVTADGTKSITDEFTVQNSVDFEVARDGATRIYPPVPYVMNFTIKANKNYTGVIREYVPASFVITPQDGLIVSTVGDTNILTWTRNLVEGETYNIYYEFDAPDVSPYLFVLGELEIGDWKETRKWRIAADATHQLWVNAYDNTKDGWTKVGSSPYLDAQDQPTNYGYNATNKVTWGVFDFADSAALGTINSVHFYAYGKCAHPPRNPTAWGWDGSAWQDFKTFPFAEAWGWGNIDLTVELDTWTKINGVRLYIEARTAKAPGTFVDACYILVDYTPLPWVSYSDSGHTTVCNDFVSYETEHTVYMSGSGFAPSTAYRIIYWDGTGANRKTDDKSSDADGVLSSSHTFVAGTDQADTWYGTVYYPQGYSPGSHDPNDAKLVVDDTFEVKDSAIPEFSTVIAAIAVCMLCAISYMVMRRKVGKG